MVNHHPSYHFHVPSDWMNDPKLFFWEGTYHVFFQYSITPDWSGRLWGHTISRDLVHWELLPVALKPAPDGPDKGGCWTGCVVAGNGKFHILYTGVSPQVQCLASSDDMVHWTKHPDNPVMPQSQIPDGFGPCWRDPCAWKEGDDWYVLVGSSTTDPTRKDVKGGPLGREGAALLYRSKDLIHWEYLHPLFVGERTVTGRMFECPDFFELGNKHVLLTSCGLTYWHVGEYRDHRFSLERLGATDGGNFYAAKTLLDDKGRRILWGWITEARAKEEQVKDGWSGALSLPREMKLMPDGSVGIAPVKELESLRGRHWHFENLATGTNIGGPFKELEGVRGDALEIIARFEPCDANEFGLAVRCAPGMAECKEITYFRDTRRLNNAPLTLAPEEGLELRVFVDRSVIEAFANDGRACQTERVYPTREDALGVAICSRKGNLRMRSVDVWEMTGR